MSRRQWINVRGMAIVCVIIIHTMTMRFSRDNALNNWVILFFDQISRFAVPVFFISSGFGLGSKYMDEISIWNFYKKRLKIIPEYIVWSMAYFFLRSSEINIWNLLIDIITGNASGHLYFIIVLIQFYFIFPFIRKIAIKKSGLIISLVVSLGGQLIYQSGIRMESYLFCNWLIYFVLGVYLANHRKHLFKFKQYCNILFPSGAIIMLSSAILFLEFSKRPISLISSTMRPSMIFYSVGVLSWFLVHMAKPMKIFETLDKHSLSIYYVHMIFLKALLIVLGILKINTSNFFMLILVAGITVTVSLIFSILYDYFRKKFFCYLKVKKESFYF